MHIVRVIPISRGIAKEELSYFTTDAIESGVIVQVPIRKRDVPALALSSTPVKNVKAQVRTADFSVRKIKSRSKKPLLTQAFMRAAERTARFHAATVGALLYTALPQAILEKPEDAYPKNFSLPKEAPRTYTQKKVIQARVGDRYKEYKNLAREMFAQKKSTLILCPTIEDAERLFQEVSRGTEKYALLFTGRLSRKEFRSRWLRALTEPHPLLIVGTPNTLALPRTDLGTIIIEREQSSSYRVQSRPYSDLRVLAEYLAEETNARVVRGDLPLTVATAYKITAGEYTALASSPQRLQFEGSAHLIDMRTPKSTVALHPMSEKKTVFKVLGDELVAALKSGIDAGAHTLLFCVRRGIAATTMCLDCSATVACKECGAAVVLHKGEKETLFLCHSCGAVRSANERCAHCTSWRLQALGVGTERVEEEVKKMFPDAPLFIFDKDTFSTVTEAHQNIDRFYATPGAVLIGTEMTLAYLTQPVDTVGVVSLDSLLAVPAWGIYERLMSLLLRLRELAETYFIVQTRRAETPLLSQALTGDLAEYFAAEMKNRKRWGYPPFTILIKVTAHGSPTTIATLIEQAATTLSAWRFTPSTHTTRLASGVHETSGFLRVPAEAWPHEELLHALSTLPPSLAIAINPENIL